MTPGVEKNLLSLNEYSKTNNDHPQTTGSYDEEEDLARELPVISTISLSNGRRLSKSDHSPNQFSSSPFRARPAPITTTQPTTTPRMSKAAALRMGISITEHMNVRPASRIEASIARRPITPPKSLADPVVTPRATKASSLRTRGDQGEAAFEQSVKDRRQSISTSERSVGYEGTPGHGGRSIAVAVTRSEPVPLPSPAFPTLKLTLGLQKIVPRTTKAAQLRQQDHSQTPLPKPSVRRQSLSTSEMHAQSKSERRFSIASLQTPSSARLNHTTLIMNETEHNAHGIGQAPNSLAVHADQY